MAGRGSVGMEWVPESRPHPSLLESPQSSPPRGPQPASFRVWPRVRERAVLALQVAAPAATSPGAGSFPGTPAPLLPRRRRCACAGCPRGGGAGRREPAGRGRRLPGCQRWAARARGGARAGRTRWPGAAATTAAVALGECSIHPPPQVSLSGLRRRGPLSTQPPPPLSEAGGNGGEVSALAAAPGSGTSQVLEGGGAGPGSGPCGRDAGRPGERGAAVRQGPPKLPCPVLARGRRGSRACSACPTSGGRAAWLWAPAEEPGNCCGPWTLGPIAGGGGVMGGR